MILNSKLVQFLFLFRRVLENLGTTPLESILKRSSSHQSRPILEATGGSFKYPNIVAQVLLVVTPDQLKWCVNIATKKNTMLNKNLLLDIVRHIR